MKKSHLQFLIALSFLAFAPQLGLPVSAQQGNVATNNAEPDWLAPASATSVNAAQNAAQAAGSSSQGSSGGTSAATGAYEQHYTYANPTGHNNNLGLHPTGFGGIAPVFGY